MAHVEDPLDRAEALVLHLLENAAKTMELVDAELKADSSSMSESGGENNFQNIVAVGKDFKSTMNTVEAILLEESVKVLQPFEDYQKERASFPAKGDVARS